MTTFYGDVSPIEIANIHDLPKFDDAFLAVLRECGEASYGLGNNWTINWESFYISLEMEGWDMQDMGGPADNKIRRVVRKMINEGDIA